MPRRPKPFFSGLRRILLVLILLVAGGTAALYWFGRSGRPQPLPAGDSALDRAPEGEITMIGEGFEFTHSEGRRPVFRIRGESVRADRAGMVFLEGVGLTLYTEEGESYEVASRQARFDPESRDAVLSGNVLLRGPDDTALRTGGLRLRDRGQRIDSTGPVRFTYAGYTGRANRLRVDRSAQVYQLRGRVRIDSGPQAEQPTSLVARRVLFDRQRHQIRAAQDVELTRGEDHLEATLINAFLDEQDRTVLFVRARFEVAGRIARMPGPGAAPGSERPVRFTARSLALLRDPQGLPVNAELEGAPSVPVVVEVPAEGGITQRLVAGFATVQFAGGRLSQVETFNAPRLQEISRSGEELRELTARRLEANYGADGRLATLRADGQVRYRDPEVRAEGEQGRFVAATETAEFTGSPVHAVAERGELLAPKVTYDRQQGLLHATGGVRAEMEDASSAGLGGTPMGQGEGPVRVESREAFWRDTPRSALFRGDVRAWRGENLLTAQALYGEQQGAAGARGGERLEATGGVRTVWRPDPQRPPGGGEPQRPVEVTAPRMTYDEGDGLLVYEGGVRTDQAGQSLVCSRLEVAVDATGEAERMTCIGDARLDDKQTGNTARGERAVYDLASRLVTLIGDPAVLNKGDGGQVTGQRVSYDLETGTARVVSQPVSAAPAAAPRPTTPETAPTAPPGPASASGTEGEANRGG
ncbi:MAG TPA: LPS export ABC transporter periplasmic protein LptC [Thermoanaerobaculia bacterium]|nr:LPS export ABC transporter periplasmic protein LptC [Thermoanaerobaculia bacterium]